MLTSGIGSSTVPQRVLLQSGLVSLEANSPSEFLQPYHCSRLSTRASPTWGFGPLLDITTVRPLVRGLPSPRYVPSSGDHSLSTVFSALWLAGLFHPAAELRTTSRSGASHSVQPSFFIRRRCLRAVGTRLAHPQAGCRKPSSPTSRRCSVQSRVPSVRELASPTVAPLIGIDAPPGTLLAVNSTYSSSFAHGVFRKPSRTVQARHPKTLAPPPARWRREARSFRLRSDRPARAFEPSATREPKERSAYGMPHARLLHIPTRGSASPEGPPESPSRRRASLSFRNGAPTTSPEGLRPNHRILRRARPRPAISMASAIQLCRPEGQPGRCGRTNEALVERPPPSPTRTIERASRRTPTLRREPAEPRPHLPDPKAHGTRTGARERRASSPESLPATPRREWLESARVTVAPASVPLPKPRSRRVVRPRVHRAEPATALPDVDPKTPA